MFDRSYAVDAPALWTVLALAATGLMCIGLSAPAFRNDAREAEFYTLLLFALLGAIVLAGAGDVMEILLGVLLTSVGSYALVATGVPRRRRSKRCSSTTCSARSRTSA